MNTYCSLADIVGEDRVSNSQEELFIYSRDSGAQPPRKVDFVVMPETVEEIQGIVQLANKEKIPITPLGGGFTLSALVVPNKGGIVLDMNRYMKRMDGIDSSDNVIVCEPGIVLDDVNAQLAGFGRKIGPDPSTSNRATIGGCVANNATGAHSLMYGYIGDYVESVEAVLANGEIVRFWNNFEVDKNTSAALADIVPSIKEPLMYYRSNVDGTVNVLEASRRYEIKRFIYTASSSCYGIPEISPTPEFADIRPQYPYALTKYLGEQCVMHWGQVYRIPAVSLFSDN